MEARESFSAAAAARPRSRTRGHTPRYETTRLQSRCRPHLPPNPKASTVVVQTKHSSINSPINHVRCGGKQSGPPVPTHIQQQKTRPDTYTAVKLSLGAPPRLCRASSALSTHTHTQRRTALRPAAAHAAPVSVCVCVFRSHTGARAPVASCANNHTAPQSPPLFPSAVPLGCDRRHIHFSGM